MVGQPFLPTPPRLAAPAITAGPRAPGTTKLLYLNFTGGTVYNDGAGCDDATLGCSFIVSLSGMVQYPPFRGTPTQKQLIIDLVKAYYEPFDVQIVFDRPASGPYSMNMIGGKPEDIGLGPGAVGIAPLDCSDLNDHDLSFTFPAVVANDPLEVAQTIAQETAHAYGLGHTSDRTDVMFPYVQKDSNGFQNFLMNVPDNTDCTGTGHQNSYQLLMDNVGASPPDVEPPTVAFTDPLDGATVPSGFSVTLDAQDNRSVHDVELFAGAQMVARSTVEPWVLTVPSGTLPGGPTLLRAVAHDRTGNQGEAQVMVTLRKLGETPGDLGNACAANTDCNQDGVCAAPAGGAAICTRACGSSAPCPAGFDCVTTPDYQQQCARPAEDSGCSVAFGAPLPSGLMVWIVAIWIDRRRRGLLRRRGC
jgi:Big-like domain-containing protein